MLKENALLVEKLMLLHGVLHDMGCSLKELQISYPHGPSAMHTCSESCPAPTLHLRVVRVGALSVINVELGVFTQPAPFMRDVTEQLKLVQNIWDAQASVPEAQLKRMFELFDGSAETIKLIKELQARLNRAGIKVTHPW